MHRLWYQVIQLNAKARYMELFWRQQTFRYQFKVNGIMIPVCKMFFVGTLNMKEWSIRDWSNRAPATNTAAPVQKVATHARLHGTQELYDSAKLFLEALPKIPSHYSKPNQRNFT